MAAWLAVEFDARSAMGLAVRFNIKRFSIFNVGLSMGGWLYM